jgi:hypothetical protein
MAEIPTSLPPLAQDYTPEQRQACVDYLASLPLKELRSRQSIKNQEIDRAHARQHELGLDILTSVQEQAEIITSAIILQQFGTTAFNGPIERGEQMNTYTPTQQVTLDLLTTACEGGIGYWSVLDKYKWDCPPEAAVAAGESNEPDGDDDKPITFSVDLAKIEAAARKIATAPHEVPGLAWYRDGVTTPWSVDDRLPTLLREVYRQADEGNDPIDIDETSDIDAGDADIVFQIAALGELVYG